jgi:hypothetical protein
LDLPSLHNPWPRPNFKGKCFKSSIPEHKIGNSVLKALRARAGRNQLKLTLFFPSTDSISRLNSSDALV